MADGPGQYLWGLVNFRGPAWLGDQAHRPYVTYSAFDLLTAENEILNGGKPAIDPATFRDKLVFVGVTISGLRDAFQTPFSTGPMPAIQIQAAIADDFLSNRFMRPERAFASVAAVIVMAAFAGVIALTMSASLASVAVSVLVLSFLWLTMRLFAGGYWLNVTEPVLASAASLGAGVAYRYFVDGREQRKIKALFGRYVPNDVYRQLVEQPELARLGGQRREMTVLFSDIRGFTSFTERAQPEEIVQMMNEYFTTMVDIVFRHKGTLDKFVGDMVMALFGAPLDDPEHADHAVSAAVEMVAASLALNARWKAAGHFSGIDIGVGVNTGAMIAGNMGSAGIMSYTVVGDAVNLGARLESLNKDYATRIIISDATRQQLTRRFEMRPLGEVVVRGNTRPVAIFEVTGHVE